MSILLYLYPSWLLRWHGDNHTIVPVAVEHPWKIRNDNSRETTRDSRDNYNYKNSKTVCYAVFNSTIPDDAYVNK